MRDVSVFILIAMQIVTIPSNLSIDYDLLSGYDI